MIRAARLGLLVLTAAVSARAETPAETGLAFVYVYSNVGLASGGHAALRADSTVYHLQNSAGLLLLVRESWSQFRLVYTDLQNRPLEVAHIDAEADATERVQRSFSRVYVDQKLAFARRTALRDDVAWLEALARGGPAPPLRGAGLVAPERAGDPDAARLSAAVVAQLGDGALAAVAAEADRRVAAFEPGSAHADLIDLREALALREAVRALSGEYGLAPEVRAALPAEIDDPLTPAERAALLALASQLEGSVAELLGSRRPDRGYALLLAQARYLAVQRSLASDRLVLLDAFRDAEVAPLEPDELDADALAGRREAANTLFRRGRGIVLGPALLDEMNLNLLEEAASIAARDGRADAAGALSEYGERKLPATARSVEVPAPRGDLAAALEIARARLAEQEARLEARWGYDLTEHNCITELARTSNRAFDSESDATAALGAEVPGDGELFGFVPFVFFERLLDRLRIDRIEPLPNRRAVELERLLHESPGLWTSARESLAPASQIYTPRPRDSAFLLFTDDVFWRRPPYGAVNLMYALGYTVYGATAAPFDGGTRVEAGASGLLWSMPELGFFNVRKGTFDP